jgi:hypothetical protein
MGGLLFEKRNLLMMFFFIGRSDNLGHDFPISSEQAPGHWAWTAGAYCLAVNLNDGNNCSGRTTQGRLI